MSDMENGWYLRSEGYVDPECEWQRITVHRAKRALDNHGKLVFIKFMGGKEVGSRVYKPVETCEPNWVLQFKTQTQEFWRCECGNCGESFGVEDRSTLPFKMTIDEVNVPNFCPECGAKQKAVEE